MSEKQECPTIAIVFDGEQWRAECNGVVVRAYGIHMVVDEILWQVDGLWELSERSEDE